MNRHRRSFSIGLKLHVFITAIVLTAVLGTALIAYFHNAEKNDRSYKSAALSSARDLASLTDPVLLLQLRTAVESEEYQELRQRAEEENNPEPVRDYLQKAGLLDRFMETQELISDFLSHRQELNGLYIVTHEPDSQDYTYLMSGSGEEFPLYYLGYTERVGTEFANLDPDGEIEPTISNTHWGWLCSAYAPVSLNGTVVCYAGSDVSMDEVVQENYGFLMTALLASLLFIIVVLALAVPLINRMVIKPLEAMTEKMKEFSPAENASYEESGVISLDIHSGDEIQNIYDGIHDMQTDIIDYLNHMAALRRERERAYNNIREKDEQIGEISRDAYSDALTSVGSTAAYNRFVESLKMRISEGFRDYAVVMMDVNNLKKINDQNGHSSGDLYIQGCCRLLCREFCHSPVFRIGGDEFVAILTGEDYENREGHMESLRASYAKARADASVKDWEKYSASVGMAECARDESSYETVFQRADNRMYKEKEMLRRRDRDNG